MIVRPAPLMPLWRCRMLYQGDCRDVIKREGIDLKDCIVVTDPPFNIGYHYKSYKDRMKAEEYEQMIVGLIHSRAVIIHYPEALHAISMRGGG